MRQCRHTVDKVNLANVHLAGKGTLEEPNSDPWEFDYVLLCNKICGKSHYNMQMKIIVETEEEYQAWLEGQQTFKETMASMQP